MFWLRNTSSKLITLLKQHNGYINRTIQTWQNLKVKNSIKWNTLTVFTSTVTFGVVVCYASEEEPKKKKLVILGSGWGAVSLLKSLTPGEYDVSVVSPDNYFLFTPLLPGVTVGTVEGRSIIEPIRKILSKRHKNNAKFYEAECTNINVQGNSVTCKDLTKIVGHKQEFQLNYDYLVVAVGAQTATYNIDGIREHTHYLKNIHQAQQIRKDIMDSFETAAIPGQSEAEIRRLLHFVVVGGGPTGVEFAAELCDFVKRDLKKYYPAELVDTATITLVDGLNKILNTYSEEISRYTENKFKRDGIDVVTNTFVAGVEKSVMHLKDAKTKETRTLPYGLCVWCAGIAPRELTKQLMKDIPGQTNRNALITDPYLRVKNALNVFAVGDCCTVQYEQSSQLVDKLLKETTLNQDGEMTAQQFNDVMKGAKTRYPQFCHHFVQMEKYFASKNSTKTAGTISRDDFMKLAQEADSKQTGFPPTAQVAGQEGKYLGKLLSRSQHEIASQDMEGVKAFTYNHLGSFAYVGDNRAVLQLPVMGTLKGWSTMWLWRGAYTSECVSIRMRVLVLFDWMKSFVFGRDLSRI